MGIQAYLPTCNFIQITSNIHSTVYKAEGKTSMHAFDILYYTLSNITQEWREKVALISMTSKATYIWPVQGNDLISEALAASRKKKLILMEPTV